jgi:hypothetical protein
MTTDLQFFLDWLYGRDAELTTEDLMRAALRLRRLGYVMIDGIPRFHAGKLWLTEKEVVAMVSELRGITGFEPVGAIAIQGYEIRRPGHDR